MLGFRAYLPIGCLVALFAAGHGLAAPSVVTLGGGAAADDPVSACGDFAASPWEPGRDGRGVADDQVFIDGAIKACEEALAAEPTSVAAQTWLGRAYYLAGRSKEAEALLIAASDAYNPYAAYLLVQLRGSDSALLEQAANGRYAPAQYDLGKEYEFGVVRAGDYSEAQRLYQLAADQDYPPAVYKLGLFEQGGYLAEPDYALAMEHYERAAALGEPLGYTGLGQLYELGQGVEQDNVRAIEFYRQGAEAGEPISQTALAYFYEHGIGIEQDYDQSFALLSSASAQDWGYAHAALAIHYLFGQGTEVDEPKAFDLAWRAQGKGVAFADGILGYMYQHGLGTVRTPTQALLRYQAGAERGDQFAADQVAFAEAELACQDAAGSPLEPGGISHGVSFADLDPTVAIPACEAVSGGHVGNRVWLGRAYARAGRYDEAVPLLEEGIAAGNVLAHTVLADMLMAGAGVEADPERALGLYRAVAMDFGLAQYGLGVAYRDGVGVPQDRAEALRWLRLADRSSVPEAAGAIAALLADGGEVEAIDLTGFGREGPAY